MTDAGTSVGTTALAERIDALLPQTQCQRCGYADCHAYAAAIAAGETGINRCPPGGEQTIEALAELLHRTVLLLDPDCGTAELMPMTAFVREDECIGCYKCAAVCPVDAFVGAPGWIHTVIESECTGCGLCVPACPVDCIEMRPRQIDHTPVRKRAEHSRMRYRARQERLAERKTERGGQRLRRLPPQVREARITSYLEAARQRVVKHRGQHP